MKPLGHWGKAPFVTILGGCLVGVVLGLMTQDRGCSAMISIINTMRATLRLRWNSSLPRSVSSSYVMSNQMAAPEMAVPSNRVAA